MMLSRRVAPINFGVENLYSKSHGNVTILLQDKESVTADSMVLAHNSPIFKHLCFDLKLSTIELDEFDKGAVRSFVEALYAGKMELEEKNFREINRIACVTEVSWLMRECRDYFWELAVKMDLVDIDSVLFLIEEACFVDNTLNEDELIVIFHFQLFLKGGKFILPYLEEHLSNMSTEKIQLMIQISGDSFQDDLLNVIKHLIIDDQFSFNEKTRYFLQNIDYSVCLRKHTELFEEVFFMLFENPVSTEDSKMIWKIYNDATKAHQLKIVQMSLTNRYARDEMAALRASQVKLLEGVSKDHSCVMEKPILEFPPPHRPSLKYLKNLTRIRRL